MKKPKQPEASEQPFSITFIELDYLLLDRFVQQEALDIKAFVATK
jgi:hypothetical protein